MSLTNEYLVSEEPHPAPYYGGVIRKYTLPNGYHLSLINGPGARSYNFAWEAAIVLPDESGFAYDTPLTNDAEIFFSDDEANAFIKRAIEWALAFSPEQKETSNGHVH